MDFRLTEDQEIFRDMVRDFAKKELEPIAQQIDEKEEYHSEFGGLPLCLSGWQRCLGGRIEILFAKGGENGSSRSNQD